MKIAFGVCSLGIGHATRSIPVIKGLLEEGHEVVLITYGSPYFLLKKEFPHLKIYSLEDYPIRYTVGAYQLIPYLLANSHKIIKTLLYSHRKFLTIDSKENFDMIISDSRYDIFVRNKPSYLMIHQLRIMLKLGLLRGGTMVYNSYMSKYFKKIIVPDFEENNLSGELSHNVRFVNKRRIAYVGVLSSFKSLDIPRDVDVLISISGPEPQRSIFEKIVLNQVKDLLKGNIVITLGKPDGKMRKYGKMRIYSYLPFSEREKLMNSAKLILSRSGYSTIMDMYVIGGKAFFVPTPGQPEQIYLAKYLRSRGISGYETQERLNIADAVAKAREYKGFRGGYDVKKTLENIWSVIF